MRCRAKRAALDLPAAIPVHRLAGPQGPAERQAFDHPADTLVEWHAGGLELGADVRQVGGNADPQDQPALGDAVERRDLLREDDGIAERRQQHRGAELDLAGARRHRGQQGQRVVPRPGEQGIAHPDGVEAQCLGALGQRQQGGGLGLVPPWSARGSAAGIPIAASTLSLFDLRLYSGAGCGRPATLIAAGRCRHPMRTIEIVHRTRYEYAEPVTLGEYRLMFRPRDSHDLRLLHTDLAITPAGSIRWIHDAFGNSIAIASFTESAQALEFVSTIRLEHYETPSEVPPIEAYAVKLPFSYAAEEAPDLARYIERQYPDPNAALSLWAKDFLEAEGR
jgi:hypothetical protein